MTEPLDLGLPMDDASDPGPAVPADEQMVAAPDLATLRERAGTCTACELYEDTTGDGLRDGADDGAADDGR